MYRTFIIALAVAFAVQIDGAAAAASTIDRGAKPYIVLGGALAGLFFLSVGIVFLVRGARRRQLAARSLQWPVTEGRILSAAVKAETLLEFIIALSQTELGHAKGSRAAAAHRKRIATAVAQMVEG